MYAISKEELMLAMFNAAISCIKNFINEHCEETFFGFAIEMLAEEGYFILCASSNESFQSTYDYYIEQGEDNMELNT